MKYYSDIELQNSKITGLRLEPLDADPTFDVNDLGRIYFNQTTGIIKLNNGTAYIDVTIPSNFNDLITTLGNNWINSTYSFNPVPFNQFKNVNSLTENDSLYSVLAQLDTAISQISKSKLLDLSDVAVTQTVNAGDICYYTGDFFSFASIDSVIENYGHIEFVKLNDVDTTALAQNSIFLYDSVSSSLKAASLFYEDDDLQITTSHSITHNLGVKYCSVTLIDKSNDQLITDATVTFTDIGQIDITLANAAPIHYVLIANPKLS